MKQFLSLFLCLVMLLPLASCSTSLENTETATREENQSAQADQATEEESFTVIPEADRLSWEKIKQFPIANSSMSIQELRQLCVDFFKFSKSWAWVSKDTHKYPSQPNGPLNRTLNKGAVYQGFPYMAGTGNVYRVMEFYDPETGVLDVNEIGKNPRYFGNHCSWGSHWGWARVINSANYGLTEEMVPSNGFIPVGPYKIDANTKPGELNTATVVQGNGKETMFRSYAQMKLADLVVYYHSAGHVMMISADPVVVTKDDGTIDGDKSYVLIVDQTGTWETLKLSDGTTSQMEANIDKKFTFSDLFNKAYIPYTFAEFLGKDPIEETQCTVSFEGESVSSKTLCEGVVNANYYISDVYIEFIDSNGTVEETKVCRATYSGVKKIEIGKAVFQSAISKFTAGNHRVRISCQLGNGDRPIIYEGALTA